jgi:hypothetical protein
VEGLSPISHVVETLFSTTRILLHKKVA